MDDFGSRCADDDEARDGPALSAATLAWMVGRLRAPGGGPGRLGAAVRRVAVRGGDAAVAGRDRALLLVDVEEAGPADAAGLHLGDALLRVDDREVACFEELAALLLSRGGQRVRVLLLRGGRLHEVEVTLGCGGPRRGG